MQEKPIVMDLDWWEYRDDDYGYRDSNGAMMLCTYLPESVLGLDFTPDLMRLSIANHERPEGQIRARFTRLGYGTVAASWWLVETGPEKTRGQTYMFAGLWECVKKRFHPQPGDNIYFHFEAANERRIHHLDPRSLRRKGV
ncbi:MAG: hypothetical protein IH951_11675 [Bacteroidetes bacterium]|nr:hypothetical protein [Bacteroidota bacterium]